MRVLGIDYGTKKVGIAWSDELGRLAFPRKILKNDKKLISFIDEICKKEKVEKIVLGASYNEKGEDNVVMEKILNFQNILKKQIRLQIILEKEFFTSIEARRYQKDKIEVDDSSAALILQRYLDKKNLK